MEQIPQPRKNRRRSQTSHGSSPASLPNAFTLAEPALRRPGFQFLSDDDIAVIRERAIELVADHGIIVIHPTAFEALKARGARDGRDANRLKLPRELIEEALADTPKSVRLCGKSPARDMVLPRADGGFIMRTGTGAHGFVDPETSKYRNMGLADVATIAGVANHLDEIGFIAHPFVHGVPELTSDIHSLAALIARTDKHVWVQPYNKENIDYLFRLAVIAAGGEAELKARPLASCITCSFSPLEFKVMDVEVMIQAGKLGIPLHACSLPSAGGTAPLTVPGLVLMAAAEIISMVTMAHVLAPGTPVIATPLMFTLDMRTGSALQSCVESRQAATMAIQVMKRGFGLIAHTYGAGSDTPDVDLQSMTERALLGQDVALAGADILGGVGQLECATVFSPVQAVLDNELGAMVRRYIQVPRVDDENLNWNEVPDIRAGGHFLDSGHTLKYCRTQHIPGAFLRQDRDGYEAGGRRTAFDQARDICRDLLAKPQPPGLPDETAVAQMADVVRLADKHILEAAAANTGANVV
jgi:trimethylamine:corrinoid methyltransferase-like protein